MNMIISAGGSGGHIYPALAIISEFQKREKELNVLYIGTHNRMEKDIIPAKGILYESLEIYGFTKDMKRNIKNIFLIHKAEKKCLHLMKTFQPDIVIGVGGYVTYPVLKAAKKLHIKTFIHEQNSRPGKVNYLTSHYADLVGCSFKSSMEYFKKAKQVMFTGHPSLDTASEIKLIDKTNYGLKRTKKLVTIVAGSLGSQSLSDKLIPFLNSDLHKNYEILYVVGNNVSIDSLTKQMKNQDQIVFVPYIENLAGILKASDLIISRAGAGTLFEIIGLEKPSIIIPSPNVANNHQYYNAKELVEGGMIHMLEEAKITPENLAKEINLLLENQEEIANMQQKMMEYKTIHPLENIYSAIKNLIHTSK